MGKSGNLDTGTNELAPHNGEFLAGVLALSRISRVTVALESGHGGGPALLAAARLTAHAETCVLFDQWRGDPLADLTAALFRAYPDQAPAPHESLVQGLRQLKARECHSFLIILDRFDEYLAQDPDQPHIAAFDRAFVQMANDSEVDVHFLLVQDEAAESLLGRFQNAIPGIGDGCLRMPTADISDSRDDTTAPETGRASQRDRSFGRLLERLTAIVPGDEVVASQPGSTKPVMAVRPAEPEVVVEPRQPVNDLAPDHAIQPVVDDTVVNAASRDRQEPVFPMQEPVLAPLSASQKPPVAIVMAAAPRIAVDPPTPESVTAASTPRRGNALAATMAVILAVGAGLYAYKHQGPSAPADASATAAPTVTTEKAASATASTIEAAPTPAAAEQPQPTAPAPALMAAPALAPATPAAAATPVTTPATGPAGARNTPTVYVHVRSQRERERMQAMARTLAQQGIRVVDVKVMSTGPSVADLRYFRDEDKATAVAVQKAMVSAGVPAPKLSRMNGYEGSTRPGHVEAWLGGGKG